MCISNFKKYQISKISNKEYQKTRDERVKFLESIGLNSLEFNEHIPLEYQEIPDFIWLDVIKNLLKKLEKNEDISI